MSSRTSTNPKLAGRGKGAEGPKGVAGGKRGNAGAKARRGASRNQGAVAHPMAQTPGIMKFYTDDAPGIKMWVPRAASPPPPPPLAWTMDGVRALSTHSIAVFRLSLEPPAPRLNAAARRRCWC